MTRLIGGPVPTADPTTDLRPVTITGQVPADPDGYDRWMPAARSRLIGQEAYVIIDGDWTRVTGTATVTGASAAPDGWLVLTLTMPAYAAETAGLVEGPAPQRLGIGWTLRAATIRDNGRHRDLRDVRLRTVWLDAQ